MSPPTSSTLPFAHRLGNLVYGHDPVRREHVKRLLRMEALAGFAALLLWIATFQGITPAWATYVETAYLGAGCAVLYATLRLGWSRRWRDPALSHAQLMFAIVAVVLAYGIIDIARGSALQLLCLLLAFEMDRLTPRQLLRASLHAVVLIAMTVVARLVFHPEGVRLDDEVYNLGMAAVLLPTAILVGLEIGRLYRRQVQQRETLAQTLDQLSELSTRDALTGLANRRQMTALLDQECKRQRRLAQPFSVALLDIDWFKRINDNHGHGVGDEVLRRFARLAGSVLGPADTLGRWGGEEFLLILPGCDDEGALETLQRVRDAVAGHAWGEVALGLRVSFSAGVAMHETVGEPLDQMLARADRALYAAKDAGRDRALASGRVGPALLARKSTRLSALPGGRLGNAPPSPSCQASCTPPSTSPAEEDGTATPTGAAVAGASASASSGAPRLAIRLLQGLGRLVLGADPDMRERLRLTVMAIVIYSIWVAVFQWYAIPSGKMDPVLGRWLIVYDLVAMSAFYPLVRSGITAHWRDAALVLPQMILASGACVVCYVAAPDLRPSVMHLMCVIQVFGMVTLTPRASRVAGVAAAGMVLLLLAGMLLAGQPPFDPRLDTLRLLLVCFIVARLSMLSTDYGRVRQKVAVEKHQLTEAVARVQELVIRDSLTGLFNRKYMHDLLERELDRCRQTGQQFCVALIDLDHFKFINDHHGHQAGDRVLARFAQLAAATLRETDVIGRWGGEEFLVLLRDTEPARHGLNALARLRLRLQELHAGPDGFGASNLLVTFSAGLTLARAGEPVACTLERADQALYAAKAAGRDRCLLDDAVPPLAPASRAGALAPVPLMPGSSSVLRWQ